MFTFGVNKSLSVTKFMAPILYLYLCGMFLQCGSTASSASFPNGMLSSVSNSGDHLINQFTPFPRGAITSTIIGSFNTTIECPSCLEKGPFTVPYGDKLFDVFLTNNSLLVFEINTSSDLPAVSLNATIPFNPNCRPSHLARSAFNNENFYVVFHSCEIWNPRRDRRNGVISPPPNTITGPSTVASAGSGEYSEDYYVTARDNDITLSDVSENLDPIDIEPASDQCMEYTNVHPLRCPSAANDEAIDFLMECRTSAQTTKLFTVQYDYFIGVPSHDELIGITGIPLTSEISDFIAVRHNSELIIINYNNLSQSPGRRTFPGRIEAMYFYQVWVGSKTWLSVVIANHNNFIVDVAEFMTTRGGNASVFELPHTNAGSCDPTCPPQRPVTSEHLMLTVQNAQNSYDFVAVNLNTSTAPSEVSRVERITQRPSFLVQFQEGVATPTPPPTTTDPLTTPPDTTVTVNPMTTHEHTTTASTPTPPSPPGTDPPLSPSKIPIHIVAPVVAGGAALAFVTVIMIGIGVGYAIWTRKRRVKRDVMTPISVSSGNTTSASSLSDRSSLSSDDYHPPIQVVNN